MSEDRFHWADYLVFAVTLVVSSAVGIFFGIKGKGQKTTEEFLMAGRNMQVLPVAVSMYVSWLSAISFLGDPVEVYFYGAAYWLMALGYALGPIPVAYFFVPIYHKMRLVSVYEFLGFKYNFGMKQVGCILNIINMMLYLAVVLYAPALALSQVSGLQVWLSIVTIGVVCTFYSTLGGMKAVLWADTIQMFVMIAGLLAIVIQGSIRVGGLTQVWQIAQDGGRINFNNFNPSPLKRNTVWTYLIGGFTRVFNPYISAQLVVQRYCTVSTTKKAQLSVYLNAPLYFLTPTLLTLIGLVMYAVFHDCDPLQSGRITKQDQLVPLLVLDILGFLPGVPGLFLACIFSASLSTLSSGQNCIAATVLKDMVLPAYTRVRHQTMHDHTAARIAKLIGVLCGMLCVGLAFLIQLAGGGVFKITLTICGVVWGPVAGLFMLAVFLPFVDTLSAFIGFLVSASMAVWVALGSMFYPNVESRLPVSTAGCTHYTAVAYNVTSTPSWQEVSSNAANIEGTNLTDAFQSQGDLSGSGGLALYKLSPLLFSTFTVIITVLVACLAQITQEYATRWCCQSRDQSRKCSTELADDIDIIQFQLRRPPIYTAPKNSETRKGTSTSNEYEGNKPILGGVNQSLLSESKG